MSHNLNVMEIFQSIQGEGANSGLSCIFIRLAGCNKVCPFCDTIWDNGCIMSIRDIHKKLQGFTAKTIIWTGGEPTLQLTTEILAHFSAYKNHIETNGTNPVPVTVDYISVSPKVPEHIIKANIPQPDEIRYAIKDEDTIPDMDKLPGAKNYYLSPIFDGDKLNMANLNYCLKIIKENPKWKLSIQIHKLLNLQ